MTKIYEREAENNLKNYQLSIQCWDSKSQPHGQKSPPVPTRPGIQRDFILNFT